MKINIQCELCGVVVLKPAGEVKRSKRIGRKFYCSRSCAVAAGNKIRIANGEKFGNILNFKGCLGRHKDEYSDFRYFLRKARQRNRLKNQENTDLDLPFLKQLWETQNGICPVTGWTLILPTNDLKLSKDTASLDRIDSEKPYLKSNVRFVAYMANIAKLTFTDEELVNFCKSVVGKINIS